MAKWRHCAISSQTLREPIVACYLGNLYNKESVIEALLDRSKMPELAIHIRSLKVRMCTGHTGISRLSATTQSTKHFNPPQLPSTNVLYEY